MTMGSRGMDFTCGVEGLHDAKGAQTVVCATVRSMLLFSMM